MDVFCKIIKEGQKKYLIDQTENSLSILDIEPESIGHTLVLTKGHYPTINDVPPNIREEMWESAVKIGERITRVFGFKTYKLLAVIGELQDIPHAHIHVIGTGEIHEQTHSLEEVQERLRV
jgi:histidine triad (HIT) family protein